MQLEAFKEIKRVNGQIGFAVKVIGFNKEHFLPITLAQAMFEKVRN